MLPRKTIDGFSRGDHEFILIRHDDDFFIELDGQELMSTRRTGSEIALAELGCEGLDATEGPRVLIGGLGLGFTLRAAQRRLPADARIVVAELHPEIVDWNRRHLAERFGDDREDGRVEIVVEDVWNALEEDAWDAILLDTDNGPDSFCLERNDRLYGRSGLRRLRRALAPEGMLAVWATEPDRGFVEELERTGFEAHCEVVRERGRKGQRYAIFLARRRGAEEI